MDKQELDKLMSEAQDRYNTLNTFLEQTKSTLKSWGLASWEELLEEMNKVQGDYRTLDKLRTALGSKASLAPAPLEAPQTEPNEEEVTDAAKSAKASK